MSFLCFTQKKEKKGVDSLTEAQRESLLAIYEQVCENWRALLGVRFKLLGLVPTVSFVLIGMLLSSKDWLDKVPIWPRCGPRRSGRGDYREPLPVPLAQLRSLY